MQKPDFKKVRLFAEEEEVSKEQVDQEVQQKIDDLLFETNEKIKVKSVYTKEDVTSSEHMEGMPGLPPFTRGPYPAMYVNRPWTVRQYAGFSTAEESNAFYRRNLAMGQKVCL